MDKRGRGLSRFSVESFCTTMPKTLAGEPYCVVFQKKSGCKRLWTRKGGIKIFLRKCFCLRVPKNFVGENFCAVIQKFFGSGKLYGLERGVSRFSVEKPLPHNAENFQLSRRNHLCSVSEKIR